METTRSRPVILNTSQPARIRNLSRLISNLNRLKKEKIWILYSIVLLLLAPNRERNYFLMFFLLPAEEFFQRVVVFSLNSSLLKSESEKSEFSLMARDSIKSARKSVREDLELRWVTNLSEERKRSLQHYLTLAPK